MIIVTIVGKFEVSSAEEAASVAETGAAALANSLPKNRSYVMAMADSDKPGELDGIRAPNGAVRIDVETIAEAAPSASPAPKPNGGLN